MNMFRGNGAEMEELLWRGKRLWRERHPTQMMANKFQID